MSFLTYHQQCQANANIHQQTKLQVNSSLLASFLSLINAHLVIGQTS